jgi:tRNA G26 N,N-dimethylase Trm1
MSRTLTITAAPAAAKEEALPILLDARLLDALFARGVRAVRVSVQPRRAGALAVAAVAAVEARIRLGGVRR